MKPRLIILSDLWGFKNNDWISFYTSQLKLHFDVQFYDCCELGQLDIENNSAEKIHTQFVDRGIDEAISNLLKKETEPIRVLTFSIGGTIAWKAGLMGLKISQFTAISATRLRYENEKPNCSIQLIFGELDQYKPNKEWFSNLGINENNIPNKKHNLYMEETFAKNLCSEIYKSITK